MTGDAHAQCAVARYFRDQKNEIASDSEAVKWYRRAAEQGDADAAELLQECEEKLKRAAQTASTRFTASYNTSDGSYGTSGSFTGNQLEDYGSFLEKQLTGTLTSEERNEFDRKWGDI